MTPIHRTILNHRTGFGFRRLVTVAGLLATVLAAASPAIGFPSKLTCGKPTRNGRITVSLIVMKDDGSFGYPRSVSLDVDSSWTAVEKAAFLRTEFWARLGLRDTVKALGDTEMIDFKGQNGWMVSSVQVIADDSHEPDQVSLGLPYPEQEALCSLSGVATGRDAHGAAAFVRLTAGQTTITQPTQPGMPAEVVEQMLISQLNQAGIAARFATNDDFSDCYQSLPHDNRVIWFLAPDTTGFREEITDLGLSLDIAAALDGSPEPPSDVSAGTGAVGLRLDLAPSIFSQEGVRVRFSRGESGVDRRARIDIFDVAGRRVRTLFEGESPLTKDLHWDGRDQDHRPISEGVYFVRLCTPGGNLARRVVCVRD